MRLKANSISQNFQLQLQLNPKILITDFCCDEFVDDCGTTNPLSEPKNLKYVPTSEHDGIGFEIRKNLIFCNAPLNVIASKSLTSNRYMVPGFEPVTFWS
jgi:hypothetical protein